MPRHMKGRIPAWHACVRFHSLCYIWFRRQDRVPCTRGSRVRILGAADISRLEESAPENGRIEGIKDDGQGRPLRKGRNVAMPRHIKGRIPCMATRAFSFTLLQMHSCMPSVIYMIYRLMGLALRPQLPPLDVKSVIIIIIIFQATGLVLRCCGARVCVPPSWCGDMQCSHAQD